MFSTQNMFAVTETQVHLLEYSEQTGDMSK